MSPGLSQIVSDFGSQVACEGTVGESEVVLVSDVNLPTAGAESEVDGLEGIISPFFRNFFCLSRAFFPLRICPVATVVGVIVT